MHPVQRRRKEYLPWVGSLPSLVIYRPLALRWIDISHQDGEPGNVLRIFREER